jgi:hypothetical protein
MNRFVRLSSLIISVLICRESFAEPPAACADLESSFLAACSAWDDLAVNPSPDAAAIYQQNLCRLLHSAAASCRLHPQNGLILNTPGGPRTIPIRYVCTPWFPEEVGALNFPTVDASEHLKRVHRCPGWGVPLLGASQNAGMRGTGQEFLIEGMVFPLTAVLRPNIAAVRAAFRGEASADPLAVLEMHDPFRSRQVEIAGRLSPLAADYSSALAQVGADTNRKSVYRAEFLRPGTVYEGSSLRLLEPYQPGKMPVVFVHGARSDPLTWRNMINDLRVDPEIFRRYQFWLVRYSTGEPFLVSATQVREDCRRAQATFNGNNCDPAMNQWVLIGYSLGGPVVRLQVTYSGNALWDAFARRPFDAINVTAEQRQNLADSFFFAPQPFVTEAVYIGAANSQPTLLAGVAFRVAGMRTRLEPERQQEFRAVRRENPLTFRRIPGTFGGLPNSMDLLRRHSIIAEVGDQLVDAPWVTTHNIIGTGGLLGLSDFVVPVRVARVPGATSELLVPVGHEQIHTDARSVERVREILLNHAAKTEQSQP